MLAFAIAFSFSSLLSQRLPAASAEDLVPRGCGLGVDACWIPARRLSGCLLKAG
jgi:hypothetical protein